MALDYKTDLYLRPPLINSRLQIEWPLEDACHYKSKIDCKKTSQFIGNLSQSYRPMHNSFKSMILVEAFFIFVKH